MKVTLIKRSGELETRQAEMGQKFVGLRLESISFESAGELKKLISPEGQRWLHHVSIAMKRF